MPLSDLISLAPGTRSADRATTSPQPAHPLDERWDPLDPSHPLSSVIMQSSARNFDDTKKGDAAVMKWSFVTIRLRAQPGGGRAVSYVLGVDLGTTYTGVAVGRGEHVEMVALGDRNLVVPAIVFAGPDGSLVTGDAAVRRALDQPGRSAREFKRRLGDPTPLLLGGSPYSPAILMAAVLRAAVARVTEMNGEPPEQIVLTHPAVWGPYRREQFEQVPGLSGLLTSP